MTQSKPKPFIPLITIFLIGIFTIGVLNAPVTQARIFYIGLITWMAFLLYAGYKLNKAIQNTYREKTNEP